MDFKVKFIGKSNYRRELIHEKVYLANPYLMRANGETWVLIRNEEGDEVYYDIKYFEFIN